jgi:hypothetical protein
MGVGGQRHASAALPPGKTRYPLYRRLGGPQGRSGRVRKISPPPEFDPPTYHPVVGRNTDWAVPAHPVHSTLFLMHLIVFFNLRLGLPSGLFPRHVMCISPLHHCATLPLIIIDLTTRVMFGKGKGRKVVT